MDLKNRVQPQKLNIENIFKDTQYIIPIYQRNYAWTKDEIEQLLNDINDIEKDFEREYYLGSLIVNELETNLFEVIDGQQRLTTLYLLLSYLNSDAIDKFSLRFEAREKSNKTLCDIYNLKDSKNQIKNEEWYSYEIIDGYSVIRNYFEEKSKINNFIKEFKDKMEKVSIIRTQVPKNIDLNHYFEIMNTRGEQLELHEIVKAKILGAIKTDGKITKEDKKDRMIASIIWDACAQMDKYVQMCFSSDIREKIFGKNNWDTFGCESIEDIKKIFSDESDNDDTKFTLRSKLENPKLEDIKNNKEEEIENERFESIITFPNFILQVNEAMNITKKEEKDNNNDNGLDDKQFIELLEDRWSSKENALDFIFSLLKYRYLFDRYIIKREYEGQYKVEGKWSLKRLEKYQDKYNTLKPIYKKTYGATESDEDNNIQDVNWQLSLLQSCLRITYTTPKTMHWIARTMVEVGKEKTGKEINRIKKIIRILEKYCCNKIVEADYKEHKGFEIERIVFTYLDYILCRDNKSKFKDFQFQFRTSIEHFFPRQPINNEKDVDEENRDSFGNLALITVSANSKFSNMLPIHKVEQYEDVIKQSPKLMIMKEMLVDNNRVWNDETVERHNKKMLHLLEEEIELKTRAE